MTAEGLTGAEATVGGTENPGPGDSVAVTPGLCCSDPGVGGSVTVTPGSRRSAGPAGVLGSVSRAHLLCWHFTGDGFAPHHGDRGVAVFGLAVLLWWQNALTGLLHAR